MKPLQLARMLADLQDAEDSKDVTEKATELMKALFSCIGDTREEQLKAFHNVITDGKADHSDRIHMEYFLEYATEEPGDIDIDALFDLVGVYILHTSPHYDAHAPTVRSVCKALVCLYTICKIRGAEYPSL